MTELEKGYWAVDTEQWPCQAHFLWGKIEHYQKFSPSLLTFEISWKCVNKEGKDKFGLRFQQKHRGLVGFVLQSVFQFSAVESLSHVQLFATPWTTHTRLPCPSPTPRAYSNSCPSSQRCHPTISSSVIPFSSCLQSFPTSESFLVELALHIRWPKYWSFSFSISPSNEYSGLISFRIDCFDLLAVQRTLKSFLQHHCSKRQFFGAQLSLWSNSHIHKWQLEKHRTD